MIHDLGRILALWRGRIGWLLLGLGLRSFSMHPAQILAVKQEVLRADSSKLAPWARQVLDSECPAQMLAC